MALLALVSLPTAAHPAGRATARAVQPSGRAVLQQRGKVDRLARGVTAGEAESHAAAQRLKDKDARIAELKAQLQTLDRAKSAPAKGL